MKYALENSQYIEKILNHKIYVLDKNRVKLEFTNKGIWTVLKYFEIKSRKWINKEKN